MIVGPTGSGKTGVGVKLAQALGRDTEGEYRGEIISADSRAIYKGMDIGTAKPSALEQEGVAHWGLDLAEPGERFTVADWKKYAEEKIAEISARGHTPIVVGGTGLYVDALVFDYSFSPEAKENYADRDKIGEQYLVVGVKTEAEVLRGRLRARVDEMFCPELYEETGRLVEKYGWGSQAMKSNIYEFAWKYLQGEMSLEEAKEKAFYSDWHLAKRQMTWLKRNAEINWMPLEQICDFVIQYM